MYINCYLVIIKWLLLKNFLKKFAATLSYLPNYYRFFSYSVGRKLPKTIIFKQTKIYTKFLYSFSKVQFYLENMMLYFHLLLCSEGAWRFTLKIRRNIFIFCCAPRGHGRLP